MRPTFPSARVAVARAAAWLLAAAAVAIVPVPAADAAIAPLRYAGIAQGFASGTAGDFDGDGFDDTLFTAGADSATLVLGGKFGLAGVDTTRPLGARGITFKLATGRVQTAISAGDFDRDGLDDVVVSTTTGTDYIVYGSKSAGGTTTTLAPGSGVTAVAKRFITGQSVQGYNNPSSDQTYGIGDFNGDGYDDVTFGGGGGSSIVNGGPRVPSINANGVSARVSLLHGEKTCKIYRLIPLCIITDVSGFPVGDFNGDGKSDLYITAKTGVHRILLGHAGTFALSADATNAYTVALPMLSGQLPVPGVRGGVGDVNGDGLDDAIFDGTTVLLGRRNPPATIPATEPTIRVSSASDDAAGVTYLRTIGVGDQNGDGNDDLLVFLSSGLPPKLVTALPSVGGRVDIDGIPAAPGLTLPANPVYSFVSDFDGDGLPDLIVPTNDGTDRSIILTHVGVPVVTPPTPVGTPPTSLTDAGWSREGNADFGAPSSPGTILLTPNSFAQTGAWVWNQGVDYNGKTISFDAEINSGNGGAEGMTVAFLNTGADGRIVGDRLGSGGASLGFGGLSGLAVALDEVASPGEAKRNVVGLTDGSNPVGVNPVLHWLQRTNRTFVFRYAGPLRVSVTFLDGAVQVSIGGDVVLYRAVTLPTSTALAFTASTNATIAEQHIVSNLSITNATG